MSSRSREKIALVVFAGLIILSLCGLGWYLLAGHSWNVAASNLDDTFGSMDGYTAIVYPGTAAAAPSVAAQAGEAPAGEADGEAPDSVREGAQKPEADADDAQRVADAQDAEGVQNAEGAQAGLAAKDAKGAPEPAASDAASSGDGSLAPKRKTLDVAEAKEAYEDKGATVFALDTADLAAYREGVILKKGGHRFGVFSIEAPTSSIVLEKQIAYFKRHQVDFIVVLTPDKEHVDGISGIDIAISTQDEDLFVMGETIDGTFYVDAPLVGSVGAILISPSNVVSAKVLEEL